MVALSEQKRTEYAAYQPRFWRKTENSAAVQTPYFHRLLTQENVLALIALQDAAVVGFVIASLVPAPPVYDPGGLTCLIDDFCVAQPDLWQTAGRDLIQAVTEGAAARGAVQAVVVCGHLDEPKRTLLRDRGMRIASEWYVMSIGESIDASHPE